jgi:diguanylate cyclase (GGDEF)-like protein/PAS domain S-box-containing protein
MKVRKAPALHQEAARAHHLERQLARIRWFGVAFGAYSVWRTFEAAASSPVTLPHPFTSAVGILAGLALLNLVVTVVLRRPLTSGELSRLGAIVFLGDVVALGGLTWLSSVDPSTETWVMLYVLGLEGAVRYQFWGSVAPILLVLPFELSRGMWMAQTFGFTFEPSGPLYRVGIMAVLSSVAGIMAKALVLERKQVEQQARELSRFQDVVEASDDAIVALTPDLVVASWNPGAERVFGYPAEEAIGRPIAFLIAADGGGKLADLERVTLGDLIRNLEVRVAHREGTTVYVSFSASPITDPGGTVVGISCMARDITEARKAEEILKSRELQLAEAQRLAQVGSWEWEMSDDRVSWSDELYRVYGLVPGSLATRETLLEHAHPEDRGVVGAAIDRALEDGSSFDLDYRILRPDGAERILHGRGKVELGRRGAAARMVGTAQDVTDLRLLQDELRSLALNDPLTGLKNRRGFLTLAQHQLSLAARMRIPATLFYADLNNMKAINDRYGHQEGDRAVVEAARLLADTYRESDVIARVGGDEFCVLLMGNSMGDDDVALTRLSAALASHNGDSGHPWRLSLSVGAARFEVGQAPCSIEELMEQADQAMYQDKQRRKSRPRLLIVEDDAMMRHLSKSIFADTCDVITAATGEEGFLLATRDAPDVVLLDRGLPDVSGTEVALRLRANKDTSHIPILMVTAFDGETSEIEGLQAGADDYVTKPFDEEVLRMRVANLLRRSARR